MAAALPPPYSHAVLMGDLVRSEAAPSVSALHRTFNAAVASANRIAAADLAAPLTITLGDEFQGLVHSLSAGARIMRALRYELLSQGVECRFALGAVRLETPVPEDRAWNMMGAGLASTRGKLGDKAHPNAYRFHLPAEDAAVEVLLEAVGYAATMIERDWTERQREVLFAAIAGNGRPPQIASALGLATRTYYKVLNAARFDVYGSQWRAMDQALTSLDERYGLPVR